MKPRTGLFLLIASLFYPLGLLVISQTILSLQMYVIFSTFYIYLVGWSTANLEQELLETE